MSLGLAGGGAASVEDASLFSSGMEMTVDDEAASTAPVDDARSKLASEAAAGGVVAFSLDDVVASSSSIEGHEGVDSSILLKRSFSAYRKKRTARINATILMGECVGTEKSGQ